MTRFASHLQEHDINNPFPGLYRLEKNIGRQIVSRIGSNESIPVPAHPIAGLSTSQLVDLARLYPDPYATAIRQRAAALNQVDEQQVIVDAGADSLIGLFLRLRVSVGDSVACTAGTYPTFRYFAEGVGAVVHEVPYLQSGADLFNDLEALAAAARQHNASLVYLANPDNPTGTLLSPSALEAFRAKLPEQTLLILDEAYIDFCTEQQPFKLLPNTAHLRTLSKAYALAGLRVGYALAETALISKADQIRTQYGVSSVSQAVAIAALDDPQFAANLIEQTRNLRLQLQNLLESHGLHCMPSHTNFLCVPYPNAEITLQIQKNLLAEGIAVHRPPHPAMQSILRISAHPDACQSKVIAALTNFC